MNWAYLQARIKEIIFKTVLTVLLLKNSTNFYKVNTPKFNQNTLMAKLSTC